MMLDEADRLEKAEEEWFSKSSEIMKESAVVWTPLGEVVVPQLQKIGEHHDWKETERVLSIYGKTGKYAIGLYYVLTQAGHDHAERMIDVVVPSEIIGRKIQSFFRIITGENLPQGNIYVCDPSVKWGPDSVSEDVYANEEVEPLIPGLFKAKTVEPEKDNKRKKYLTLEPIMEYDVVIGNPPYHKSTGTGNPIWHKFVEKSFKLCSGHISLVHPAIWRKPQNNYTKCKDIQPKLFESVKYLSIYDSAEGEEVFGAGTRFDWYVADVKNGNDGEVKVVDENGETYTAEIEKWPWVPNYKYELIEHLIATNGQPKCEFIGDRTTYGSDSAYVSSEKSEEYNLPLLHTTPKTKNTRWKYSSKIQKDENGNPKHFETPKVIFGGNGIGEVIIDMEGQYGLTEEARGVVVENESQAEKVAKAIRSKTFEEIQEATSWSNYRMDRDLMNEFRKDWYETVLEIEKQRNDD